MLSANRYNLRYLQSVDNLSVQKKTESQIDLEG